MVDGGGGEEGRKCGGGGEEKRRAGGDARPEVEDRGRVVGVAPDAEVPHEVERAADEDRQRGAEPVKKDALDDAEVRPGVLPRREHLQLLLVQAHADLEGEGWDERRG